MLLVRVVKGMRCMHILRIYISGRLKYTTGDTEGAVNIFLTLLQSANAKEATKGDDEIYLEDFKLSLEVLFNSLPYNS